MRVVRAPCKLSTWAKCCFSGQDTVVFRMATSYMTFKSLKSHVAEKYVCFFNATLWLSESQRANCAYFDNRLEKWESAGMFEKKFEWLTWSWIEGNQELLGKQFLRKFLIPVKLIQKELIDWVSSYTIQGFGTNNAGWILVVRFPVNCFIHLNPLRLTFQ